MKSDRPRILLSFDSEEFDLPIEHGRSISLDEQLDVGRRGLVCTLDMLDDIGRAQTGGASATFFTTLRLAQAFPDLIQRLLSAGHELASHSVCHDTFAEPDLAKSRAGLEAISGLPVTGFRRQRMAWTDPAAISRAGYRYDSSENPTYLPGRYNQLSTPRLLRQVRTAYGPLLRIPASVTPGVRFPLFWLSVKHLPLPVMARLTRWTARHDTYAALYFHPWELVDLSPYKLGWKVSRFNGEAMRERLTTFLSTLARTATISRYDSMIAHTESRLEPTASPSAHTAGHAAQRTEPRA